MDIKSAPTSFVAPPANANPAFSGTNALPQFLVRTMKRDLSSAGGVVELKASPSIETKLGLNIEQKESRKQDKIFEAEKNRRKKELAQIFEIAKLQTEKGIFEKKEDLKKILSAPEAGWWLKWKTRSLLEEIKKIESKEQKNKPLAKTAPPPVSYQKIEPKTETKPIDSFKPMPTPSLSKITAAPPPELPVMKETPVFQPKPEIKIPTAPPVSKPPSEPAKLAEPIIPPALQTRKVIPPAETFPKTEIPSKPALPVKPLVPIKLAPETKITPKKPFSAKFVFGALIFVLLFAVGGLIYFNFSKQPTETPTPAFSSTPLSTPTPAPQISETPLFEMEGKTVIKTGGENLLSLLQETEIEDKTANSFTQIVIENNQEKTINLKEISSLYFPKLLVPGDIASSSLKSLIDPEKFTFFVFWEEQTGSSPFEPTQNQPKLGLIVKLASVSQKTELEKMFMKYEPNLPAFLRDILPENTKTDSPAVFSQNNEKNTRYFNFLPDASLSIDYAITDDYLLITTSKQSAYLALERIVEKTGPALR